MKNPQELEVLEKYLSEDELKDVAKQVAFDYFKNNLGSQNPHRKSNLDFYLGQGCLEAVKEYGNKINFDFHAQELKEKTSKLIAKLSDYNLPDNYKEIAKEAVESHREEIQNKMKDKISSFVNGDDYPNMYKTFSEAVGEQLGDLLYNLLEEKFKTK